MIWEWCSTRWGQNPQVQDLHMQRFAYYIPYAFPQHGCSRPNINNLLFRNLIVYMPLGSPKICPKKKQWTPDLSLKLIRFQNSYLVQFFILAFFSAKKKGGPFNNPRIQKSCRFHFLFTPNEHLSPLKKKITRSPTRSPSDWLRSVRSCKAWVHCWPFSQALSAAPKHTTSGKTRRLLRGAFFVPKNPWVFSERKRGKTWHDIIMFRYSTKCLDFLFGHFFFWKSDSFFWRGFIPNWQETFLKKVSWTKRTIRTTHSGHPKTSDLDLENDDFYLRNLLFFRFFKLQDVTVAPNLPTTWRRLGFWQSHVLGTMDRWIWEWWGHLKGMRLFVCLFVCLRAYCFFYVFFDCLIWVDLIWLDLILLALIRFVLFTCFDLTWFGLIPFNWIFCDIDLICLCLFAWLIWLVRANNCSWVGDHQNIYLNPCFRV